MFEARPSEVRPTSQPRRVTCRGKDRNQTVSNVSVSTYPNHLSLVETLPVLLALLETSFQITGPDPRFFIRLSIPSVVGRETGPSPPTTPTVTPSHSTEGRSGSRTSEVRTTPSASELDLPGHLILLLTEVPLVTPDH